MGFPAFYDGPRVTVNRLRSDESQRELSPGRGNRATASGVQPIVT